MGSFTAVRRRRLRANVARVAIHVAVLLAIAIPLVLQSGRSYQEIARMREKLDAEHHSLRYVAAFQPLLYDLERLRAVANRPEASTARLWQIEATVDTEFATIEGARFDREIPAETCEIGWRAWRRTYGTWSRVHDDPSLVNLIARATCFVNTKVGASQLGDDPDESVQLISTVLGQNMPGLFRRIGATASLVDRNEASSYRRGAVVEIARSNGYVARLQNNIDAYVQEDEKHNDERLAAQLTALERPAASAERRFETRVDAIISAPVVKHGVAAEVERLALATIDANRPLWQRGFDEMEARLANEQRALARRSAGLIVFVAVGLGIAFIALLVASRLIERRHRRQLARLRLERDSLAAEVGRAAAERSLSLTEGQLRAVFESADAGIAIFDDTRRIVQMNRSFSELQMRHPGLSSIARERADATFNAIGSPARFEVALDSDVGTAWLNLSLAGVFEGDVCRYAIVTVTDITDRKAHEQRLREDSRLDPLTGLANRKAFVEDLSAACALEGHAFALMFIDLDDFKPINDRFGHAAGDAVLTTVGARLRAAVSGGDTVARLGGDEFAVLMRDVPEARTAAAIAERVGRDIDLPISIAEGVVTVSASIGIAQGMSTAASPEELLARADAAMYRAKAAGTRYALDDGGIIA